MDTRFFGKDEAFDPSSVSTGHLPAAELVKSLLREGHDASDPSTRVRLQTISPLWPGLLVSFSACAWPALTVQSMP